MIVIRPLNQTRYSLTTYSFLLFHPTDAKVHAINSLPQSDQLRLSPFRATSDTRILQKVIDLCSTIAISLIASFILDEK